MPTGPEVEAALARAVAWLEREQRPSGEFPVLASTDPTLEERAEADPSVFPTALLAHSLSFWPGAAAAQRRALAFLQAEMDRFGLWRHWTRAHPHHRELPPDVDDTSCASAALAAAGLAFPDNRPLLLANRDREGRFFTWLSPRLRWSGTKHLAVTLRQLRHAPTLWLFFRRTSAAPRDVDAAVNANALFYLGAFEGDEAVVAFLASAVAEGAETRCDKWYENRFVIWYFLSRALAGRSAGAEETLRARVAAAAPAGALEAALALCALASLGGRAPAEAVARLLGLQRPDGAWPRAAFYHGGRERRRDGAFAEPHPDTPRWGSEALTTGLCIEALARWLGEPAR
ncbi:MAG: hypothetical protein JOZ90_14275 [Alphaproteobacteria bacterium]|nr:hypothetical protein [Alphaproteobacteria bacterium]MBV9372533.1 hypothetical protein [Alphaproteobacteria bacterium]MBV9902238.1 hypothetical protein [Alphaproteobacteria bacterium]